MNDFRVFIRNARPLTQFFLLLAVTFFAMGLLGAMSLQACETFFSADWDKLQEYLNDPSMPGAAEALKTLQLFNTLGLFLIPAMLFSQIYSPNPVIFLRLDNKSSFKTIAAIVVLIVAFIPITDALSYLNEQIVLPDFLSGFETNMRQSSQNTQSLMAAFLEMDSFGQFLINLLLLAVLPALGEEFFFRGILQRLMLNSTRNVHLGVWITAFAFGAMHQQFFAIIPLVLLGAILGYLKEWSGSLWTSVIAHFINNATIVVVMYFGNFNMSDVSELSSPSLLYLLPSILICGGVLFFLYKNRVKPRDNNDDLDAPIETETEL